jgi:inositol-phosphate phosphatase/L-galactose 1-phosphate phosphatase/histidinol-phosphatase
MQRCPSEFVDLATRLVNVARPIVKQYFRTPIDVIRKGDESPVTIADREAERVMREILDADVPDHGINGEEWGLKNPDAEWCWHLDPIDGTKSFISGSLGFGTLVGLTYRGEPMLGVIDQAITDERWFGTKGQGTTLNNVAATTRKCEDIAEAHLYTSGLGYLIDEKEAPFMRLRRACGNTRYSHDCYAAGLLASGFVDLLVEVNLSSHDIAALAPVITEAGGVITDWRGDALSYGGGIDTVLAAGDPKLHAKALEILEF